jgi:hypothetical protein
MIIYADLTVTEYGTLMLGLERLLEHDTDIIDRERIEKTKKKLEDFKNEAEMEEEMEDDEDDFDDEDWDDDSLDDDLDEDEDEDDDDDDDFDDEEND